MSDPSLADALRARIIAGEFAPGERLSEAALAARLDVSRNTLREAFRVLAQTGLVEHVPNRGVSVASPSTADVVDIYRARRRIECGIVRESSPLHPSVAVMREELERAEAAVVDGDWAIVASANTGFHRALVALSDSPRLERIHEQLLAELRLAFLAIADFESLHRPFVGRNRIVRDTLVEQGPHAAADELEAYLTESERLVLGAYARLGRA